MAKTLRRTIASCEKMCWSYSPIRLNSRVFLEIEVAIEVTLPIGNPSKVALVGSMKWELGKSNSM